MRKEFHGIYSLRKALSREKNGNPHVGVGLRDSANGQKKTANRTGR